MPVQIPAATRGYSDYILYPNLTETAVQDATPTESYGNFGLRPVHGDLHAGIARPGGGPGTRRAGRRAAAGGAADRGGFQQRAPRDPDPVQPHPGGQAMTVAPIAASSACPR